MGYHSSGKDLSGRSQGGIRNRGKALARFQWEAEWIGKGEKQKLIYTRLGMKVPDEPPTDPITDHVISMFYAASRCRRYVVGATGAVSLPLSVAEITEVVQAYGSALPRQLLDACILSMDREYLEKS